jgi:hypothetical protein
MLKGGEGHMSAGRIERVSSIKKAASVRNVTQKHVAGRTFTLKSDVQQELFADGAGEKCGAAPGAVSAPAPAPAAPETRPGFKKSLGLTDASSDGDMVEISKGAVTLSRWYQERIRESPSLVFTLGIDASRHPEDKQSEAFQELLNAIKEAESRNPSETPMSAQWFSDPPETAARPQTALQPERTDRPEQAVQAEGTDQPAAQVKGDVPAEQAARSEMTVPPEPAVPPVSAPIPAPSQRPVYKVASDQSARVLAPRRKKAAAPDPAQRIPGSTAGPDTKPQGTESQEASDGFQGLASFLELIKKGRL